MTYKNTLIMLFIIALGLAAGMTFVLNNANNTKVTNNTLLPDAFMENVTATIMDKYGKPKMKIVTPKMTHFTENDTTQLASPELTLYRKSPTPWYITADHATATQGADLIHFQKDVMIHHAADTDHPATLIKTPSLTVHPNDQTAETDELITMTQPNTLIKAVGMRANMNTGDIKLLSQAKGEYVPNS